MRSVPHFSPVHLRSLKPLKTGQGLLELGFWNALSPEAGQVLSVRLKVLHRADDYLVARLMNDDGSDRVAIISHIEWGWLERFCPALIRAFPPAELGDLFSGSVQMYLDGVFFQTPPLPPQPRNLNSGSENDWLAACALRFDGYLCAEANGWEGQPYYFCHSLLAGEIQPKLIEEKMTALFMLQRFLMKEGVRSKVDAGWKKFRELFLELTTQPVPPSYQAPSYHDEWEQHYALLLPAGLALLQHLHKTASYTEGS